MMGRVGSRRPAPPRTPDTDMPMCGGVACVNRSLQLPAGRGMIGTGYQQRPRSTGGLTQGRHHDTHI